MSDAIPADIMKTARETLADAMGGSYSFDAFATVFANAILAERERCARIAEEHRDRRPLLAHQPSSLVIGRYEGEQAACTAVARLIRITTDPSGTSAIRQRGESE